MSERKSAQPFKIAESGCSPAEVLLFPCSGGSNVGQIANTVGVNPLHDQDRREIMQAVAEALQKIAEVGRRCYKRSSYAALEAAAAFLVENGYELPLREIEIPL